ncbi:unnamed protein product [Ranitomeya imitator]|uniref:HMG box domain-containing protein n=1 Tax=Ranitomeya imitator TaxID=111125 RepID=A0ABN9KXM9_9NEOB|nr:unnamed protein product [Ranitomeya imitator]
METAADPQHQNHGGSAVKTAKCEYSLKDNKVNVLERPSQSPDLNPSENLWAKLKWQMKTFVLSRESVGVKQPYDDYADSDDDQHHDAYLERMKEEGKIRENADSDDSGDETDESFNPGEEEDEVAEEFDSNPSASSSSAGSDDDEGEKEKKKKAKKPKIVKEKKPRKKAEGKKVKDPAAPKRPMSAYMLWLNASREKIKSENPGISITDLSKKAGEIWKGMGKDKKEEWDRKAEEAKRDYEKAMKEYNENAPSDAPKKDKKTKTEKKAAVKAEKRKSTKASSPARTPVKTNTVKSKEFVSSDESSSDESTRKKASEDEEMASTPPSSNESGSD